MFNISIIQKIYIFLYIIPKMIIIYLQYMCIEIIVLLYWEVYNICIKNEAPKYVS
jgi:hypothetical protein